MIYYALGFDILDDRYTLLLNNESYDDALNLKNIVARKIDTMISEFFPKNEIQIQELTALEPSVFVKYLSNKYQISISEYLCTAFTRDEEITIIKEKIPPFKEDLEDCNTEQSPLN